MVRWLFLFIVVWPLSAWSQVFVHQGRVPQLVELYTSQGCSSCPPADQYLGKLAQRDDLWSGVVPLAFHVDYWDYLGWDDVLAAPQYSQRQRDLKDAGSLKAVYTPGWLIDGKEWRGYFRRDDYPQQPEREGGKLQAELTDNGQLQVSYEQGDDHTLYTLNAAVLGFDFSTRVKSGENRGLTLKHDFVVLEHHQLQGQGSWQLPLQKLDPKARQALVVWLTPEHSDQPQQVVAGWIK